MDCKVLLCFVIFTAFVGLASTCLDCDCLQVQPAGNGAPQNKIPPLSSYLSYLRKMRRERNSLLRLFDNYEVNLARKVTSGFNNAIQATGSIANSLPFMYNYPSSGIISGIVNTPAGLANGLLEKATGVTTNVVGKATGALQTVTGGAMQTNLMGNPYAYETPKTCNCVLRLPPFQLPQLPGLSLPFFQNKYTDTVKEKPKSNNIVKTEVSIEEEEYDIDNDMINDEESDACAHCKNCSKLCNKCKKALAAKDEVVDSDEDVSTSESSEEDSLDLDTDD